MEYSRLWVNVKGKQAMARELSKVGKDKRKGKEIQSAAEKDRREDSNRQQIRQVVVLVRLGVMPTNHLSSRAFRFVT